MLSGKDFLCAGPYAGTEKIEINESVGPAATCLLRGRAMVARFIEVATGELSSDPCSTVCFSVNLCKLFNVSKLYYLSHL